MVTPNIEAQQPITSPSAPPPAEVIADGGEAAGAGPAVSPATPQVQAPPSLPVPPSMSEGEYQAREELLSQREYQIVQQQISAEMMQRKAQLAERGYDEADINADLAYYRQVREGQYQTFVERRQMQAERAQIESTAKQIVAQQFFQQGQKFGLTLEQLMSARSPGQMQSMVDQAELRALRAGTVPPQTYGSNVGNPAAGNSDAAFERAFSEGRLPPTKENLERARKIIQGF